MSSGNLFVSVPSDPRAAHDRDGTEVAIDEVLVSYDDAFEPIEDLGVFAGNGEPGTPHAENKDSLKSRSRKYYNPSLLFTNATDLVPNEKELEARSKRFSYQGNSDVRLTQERLDALYAEFNVSKEELDRVDPKHRLDALHLRGVDDMNTQEIFDHFALHPPNELEWVNDSSCNLVFGSPQCAARALIRLGQPLKRVDSRTSTDADMTSVSSSDPAFVSPLRRIDAATSNEQQDAETLSPVQQHQAVEVDVTKHTVPPGVWYVLKAHPKSKLLLARFCMKSDIKESNAQQHSQFYRNHGNPNYGGMKGLLTKSSRKRKSGEDLRRMLEIKRGDDDRLEVPYDDRPEAGQHKHTAARVCREERSGSDDSSDDSLDDVLQRPKAKKFRMRMRADDEELRKRGRKAGLHTMTGAVNRKMQHDAARPEKGDLRERLRARQVTVEIKNPRARRPMDYVDEDEDTSEKEPESGTDSREFRSPLKRPEERTSLPVLSDESDVEFFDD